MSEVFKSSICQIFELIQKTKGNNSRVSPPKSSDYYYFDDIIFTCEIVFALETAV